MGQWAGAIDVHDASVGNGLKDVDLFAGVPADERHKVERLCRWRRYAAQEQIIDRQSGNSDVYCVVRGRVRIVVYSLSGRELTLDDIVAGGHFGELAAIDGQPRSASVMALEDTTLAILPAEHFRRAMRECPVLADNVMRRLVSMVRASTDRIIDLSTLGANNRVHAELLRRARQSGTTDAEGHVTLSPIPVHGDIASRVSTARETVARVLNDLARQGIVRRDRDALVILDMARLAEMVESVRGE